MPCVRPLKGFRGVLGLGPLELVNISGSENCQSADCTSRTGLTVRSQSIFLRSSQVSRQQAARSKYDFGVFSWP